MVHEKLCLVWAALVGCFLEKAGPCLHAYSTLSSLIVGGVLIVGVGWWNLSKSLKDGGKLVLKFVKKWFILFIVWSRLLPCPRSHINKPLEGFMRYIVIYIFRSVKTSVNVENLWQQQVGVIHRVTCQLKIYDYTLPDPQHAQCVPPIKGKTAKNMRFIPNKVLVWISFLIFDAALFLFHFVSYDILI